MFVKTPEACKRAENQASSGWTPSYFPISFDIGTIPTMEGLTWIVIRWVINAGALLLVSRVVEGIRVESFIVALAAALILGIVNAIIRPVLLILTLPINLITLGLFTFIINAALLLLVASVVEGFIIEGFASALIAALILWVVSLITSLFFHRDR